MVRQLGVRRHEFPHSTLNHQSDLLLALFDMPNLNRFDILSISIFFKSVDISTIDMSYRYIEQGYRAADLDWIVGPEYSLGGYIFGDSQLLRNILCFIQS